jgi:hypothetical protein
MNLHLMIAKQELTLLFFIKLLSRHTEQYIIIVLAQEKKTELTVF